jgi:ribosomal protein S21
MVEVEVRGNNIEFALKLFKGKLLKSGLLRELKERKYFLSKGERRREKIRRSIRRIRKRERIVE